MSLSNTTNQPNTLVTPGTAVTVTGAPVAIAPATVARVSFYMNGAKLADKTVAPYNTTVTLPSVGNYDFYAEVADSTGQVTTTLLQRAVVKTAPAVVTTDADVWRLLNQATFGASQAEAARVNSLGIAGWINDQMAKPISGYPDTKYNRIQLNTTADCTTQMPNGTGYPADSPQALCARDHLTLAMVQRDFFTNAMSAPDQLRQRVAWALSQIIVTSANEPDLSYAHVMSRYQNILFQEAFGNYENLLLKVTYNPAMGNYLDMVNNDRPAGSRVPNENYAREIMQLFSVGLYELNPDGSYILDAQNQPVQTYGQTEIAEFARVFTGYTYANSPTQTAANGKQGRYYGANMVPYPTTTTTGHDPNAKTLLNGTVLPAGQTGKQDIDAAVRNVFMHPNTGPFVASQLIQRLVTGNPSKAYVARVAAVFDNNGSNVRGDLAAVVRAILLDAEARGGPKAAADYGQLREPVLMVTGLLRALNGVTDGNNLEVADGQPRPASVLLADGVQLLHARQQGAGYVDPRARVRHPHDGHRGRARQPDLRARVRRVCAERDDPDGDRHAALPAAVRGSGRQSGRDGHAGEPDAGGRAVPGGAGTDDRDRRDRGPDQCNPHRSRADGPRKNGRLPDGFVLRLPGAALMNTNRRKFLTSTSALTASALAGNLGTWGVESANAQAATGYKAMVCVFLFGGNDSNNMIVPYTDYAEYSAVRTAASNVALTQAQLIQFNAPSHSKAFGFHPSMMPTNGNPPLAPLYSAGQAGRDRELGHAAQADDQGAVQQPRLPAAQPVLALRPAGRVLRPADGRAGAHRLGAVACRTASSPPMRAR